jgi:GAF domain-containing protein
MSAFSLVDADEAQSTFGGCDPCTGPRGTSTCSHAILVQDDKPFVVLDTLKDWRFKENKLVTEDLKLRFYAAYPMRTDEGQNIGVFCVLDDKPHTEFTMEERKRLKEFTIMLYRELQGLAHQRQRELQNRIQLTVSQHRRKKSSKS